MWATEQLRGSPIGVPVRCTTYSHATMRMRLTSFADPADLLAWNRAIKSGRTTEQALEVGDNGLGSSNLSTVAGTGPCVAMHGKANIGRMVQVCFDGKTVACEVR